MSNTVAPPQSDKDKRLEAVESVADKPLDQLSTKEVADATAWFMSTDEEEVAWAYVPVNVAAAGKPEHIVNFKLQVVDRDRLRDLRRESERTLPDGTKETDEMEANLRTVVESLIEPNLRGDPKMRVVRGQQYMDPADALKARFVHKPGIIDQLAGKVAEISGYADKDVKEVRAAGN